MTHRTWRTESREVWPFAHAAGVFRTCALRVDENDDFDPNRSVFALDEAALERDLRYELRLKVDTSGLTARTLTPAHDIDVALVARNDDAKRHQVLSRANLTALPARFEGTLPRSRWGPRRFRLHLVAFLNREKTSGQGRHTAWRLGSTLADRAFVIGPAAGNLFRVHWTSFAAQGWPPRALWKLEVRTLEHVTAEVDPNEVVQVHLNQDLPSLVALWEPSASRNQRLGPVAAMERPLIAAGIWAQLGVCVLRRVDRLMRESEEFDLDQLDRRSLAGAVLEGLRKATGLDSAELVRLAKDEPWVLETGVQQAAGVGKAYDQAALERLRA